MGGKRLYELARQGKSAQRPEREVCIKRLELVSANEAENKYSIDVFCSKGTYIRTLIDDIGKKLGCGAVMTALTRTEAYGYKLTDCMTVPVESALSCYDKITVSQAQSIRFKNGGALELLRIRNKLEPGRLYRVYAPSGAFLGLGETSSAELAVKRVYVE